jgi:hypothetical protein
MASFSESDKFFLDGHLESLTPRFKIAISVFKNKTDRCFSIQSANDFPTAVGGTIMTVMQVYFPANGRDHVKLFACSNSTSVPTMSELVYTIQSLRFDVRVEAAVVSASRQQNVLADRLSSHFSCDAFGFVCDTAGQGKRCAGASARHLLRDGMQSRIGRLTITSRRSMQDGSFVSGLTGCR